MWDVVQRVLRVLHACEAIGTQHADLHSGNLIVENPNPLNVNADERRIWITDFGYYTASLGKEILDDYLGLNRIIHECLTTIDFHQLDGRDKTVFTVLKKHFSRYLTECDATEGDYFRNPSKLLIKLDTLIAEHEQTVTHQTKRIGDYLAAEILGDRFDEWKALFVPEFVGSNVLLDRNITVLTGLRGCGKTMIFRRLTALYDHFLGPTSLPGGDSFLGFYLNARTIAEAFPWLPDSALSTARPQVINYFHVSWVLEVLEWIREKTRKESIALSWLVEFFKEIYGDRLLLTKGEHGAINHLISFFNSELERIRLRTQYRPELNELADIAFLEKFITKVSKHLPWVQGRPFYLFLDDYSLPLVNTTTQRILNAVIFRRSACAIFKVATESVESIETIGLNNKTLEEGDDFQLIDSGTEALLRNNIENARIITAILTPRMEVKYHGKMVFCRMWSSNVREVIGLFAEMVALEDEGQLTGKPKPKVGLVQPKNQDKVLREAGGKFLALLTSATNPSNRLYEVSASDRSFGEHLVKIAQGFQEIANYELLHKLSPNQKTEPPKQARKIEITNVDNPLPEEVADFYRGMIRYGVFIRDYRGKSVRGKAVPRLVLRGLLVPFFTLTFSLRDHVTMSWDGFCAFLRDPQAYAKNWIDNGGSERRPDKSNGIKETGTSTQDTLPL